MDNEIQVTLDLTKAQSRLIRRLLDKEEARLRKEQDHEPNECLWCLLQIQIDELNVIENKIFLDELESERPSDEAFID